MTRDELENSYNKLRAETEDMIERVKIIRSQYNGDQKDLENMEIMMAWIRKAVLELGNQKVLLDECRRSNSSE